MTKHGKWSTRFAYCYYVVGSIYYIYHWFLVLGVVAATATFIPTFPVFLRYFAPSISLCSVCARIAFWRRQVRFQLNGPNPSLRFRNLEIFYKEIDSKNCDAQRIISVKAVYPVDHY